MSLVQHTLATTTALLVLSLVSKLLVAPADDAHGPELLRQALHWRDVARQDASAALRLQHGATAAAYLQCARVVARDDELERAVGLSVPQLHRALEQAVTEARQSVAVTTRSSGGEVAAC